MKSITRMTTIWCWCICMMVVVTASEKQALTKGQLLNSNAIESPKEMAVPMESEDYSPSINIEDYKVVNQQTGEKATFTPTSKDEPTNDTKSVATPLDYNLQAPAQSAGTIVNNPITEKTFPDQKKLEQLYPGKSLIPGEQIELDNDMELFIIEPGSRDAVDVTVTAGVDYYASEGGWTLGIYDGGYLYYACLNGDCTNYGWQYFSTGYETQTLSLSLDSNYTYAIGVYDSYGDGGTDVTVTRDSDGAVQGSASSSSGTTWHDFNAEPGAPAGCEYTEYSWSCGGGSYASEVSWTLSDGSSGATGSGTLCLADGTYTLTMNDSYGDGWNGNTWTISDGTTSVSFGLDSGSSATADVTVPLPTACQDESACNYGADGDCTYASTGYNCDGSIADGYFADCVGNVASDSYLSWVGDGYCDDGNYGLYFRCCDFNFDNGDCGDAIGCDGVASDCGGLSNDECGECGGDNSSCADCAGTPNGSAFTDCAGQCTDLSSYIGDGWCDDGAWGIYLDCDEFNCDEGDCVDECGVCSGPGADYGYNCDGSLADGFMLDCVGTAVSTGYLSWQGDGYCDDGAYGLDFQCCDYNFDNGDCGDAIGCDGNALDCGGLVNDECGDCGGDNSSCSDCAGVPNGGAFSDCAGTCLDASYSSWNGDGYCDDGAYGVDFVSCGDFNCDGGDCGLELDAGNCVAMSCADQGLNADCIGTCFDDYYLSYQGDGWCDDGAWGLDFTCCDYNQDDGDCGNTIGCDGVAADCGGETYVDCAGNCGGSTEVDDCGECGGDNSSCADCAGTPYGDAFTDCAGTCAASSYLSWQGDGWCDDGAYGIDFVCADFNCDDGDCGVDLQTDGSCAVSCTDCAGNDCYGWESWIGDGWCDDGAYGFYFDCDDFNCDNGDCIDDCGDCSGGNQSCSDCAGVPYGDSFVDCAGSCIGASYLSWIGDGWCDDGAFGVDFVTCDGFDFDGGDCDDECGVPLGDNTSCADDCGVPNGDGWSCLVGSGDIDQSGGLDVLDVVGIVNHILGFSSLSDGAAAAADVTADGTINVLDVISIVEAILAAEPEGCDDGYVDDCSGDGDCCPQSYIGDGFGDCEDQAWGCDLTCYDEDGGDCATASDDGGDTDGGDTGDEGCGDGYSDDCSGDGDCCPDSWIGDGFADCEDQAYGCDLTCYDEDGGDCATASDDGGSEECADCEFDFTNYGSECCDTAAAEYGIPCSALEGNYGWDCTGCECPLDSDDGGDDGGEPEGCADGQFDCGDGQCINASWFCDGSTEFCNAGWPADCANGADEGLDVCGYEDECVTTEACDGCEFDFTNYGSECCDTAAVEFGIDCATLESNYSWDCSGCACPLDSDDGGDDSGDDGGECVNDDSTSDSYGDTCSSWYDSFEGPGSSGCTGAYDDDDFNAAEQCCACQGDSRSASVDTHLNDEGFYELVSAKKYSTHAGTISAIDNSNARTSKPAIVKSINDHIINVEFERMQVKKSTPVIKGRSGEVIRPTSELDKSNETGVTLDKASSVILVKSNTGLTYKADGFVGFEMTLEHGSDFQISMTSDGFIAGSNTDGTTTKVVVVNHESDELFTSTGHFEIVDVIAATSGGQVLSVEISTAQEFMLGSAYPNPFNPTTSLSLDVPENGFVSVNVYNMTGQLVSTLADANMDAGSYSLTWDASDMSSGMYIVKAVMNGSVNVQKVMLLK